MTYSWVDCKDSAQKEADSIDQRITRGSLGNLVDKTNILGSDVVMSKDKVQTNGEKENASVEGSFEESPDKGEFHRQSSVKGKSRGSGKGKKQKKRAY